MEERYLQLLKEIVFRHVDRKVVKVFIFGSRATGDARIFSDVDLGLESDDEISSTLLVELKGALEESNLPYHVDVVDFSKTADKFKKIAKEKVLYLN